MKVHGVNPEVLDEVKAGKIVFTTLSDKGDERLVWDSSDPQQIKDAMEIFDGYMKKGHVAFLINDKGEQGEQINANDWKRMDVRQREEILFKKPQEVHLVGAIQGG
jgi:hypothetical protein